MDDSQICADLHCHSVYSDGVLAPAALAQRASRQGVQLWSLTDHDELSGIKQARAAAQALGMQFVAGVEISVTWAGKTIHVVGLGVDEDNDTLNQGLAQLRYSRDARANRIAQYLDSRGVEGSLAGALRYVNNPSLVSRTHFARYLLQAGYVDTLQQAFDRYLGDQVADCITIDWAKLADALDWIRAASGVAVLAHPGRYGYDELQFDALLTDFRHHGGEAIEVNTGSHTPAENRHFANVAREYGFLASCGSDFHGPGETRLDLGEVARLPADLVPVWTRLACTL